MKYVSIKGKMKQVPIYGNFCPKCNTDSEKIHGYNGGLAYCTLCNHTFTMYDMEKKIKEFWRNTDSI